MKVDITIIDPTGNRKTETLDDGGTGLVLIGNAHENAEGSGVLRLVSTEISKLHAQLEFDRKISASPFELQHGQESPVCHLIVLSDKQNIYRADHAIATPPYQFIPWYKGDAYVFGDYTLLFDQENTPTVPFTVEMSPNPATLREISVEQPLSWQITVKTSAVRIPNVKLDLILPDEFSDIKGETIRKIQPKLLNINETRSGTATLEINIPKDIRFRTGEYTFLLRASSEEYQFYQPLDTKIRLKIQPFHEFAFAAQPSAAPEQTIAYFRTWWFLPHYWFTLQNQSNHAETFAISAKDTGGKSRYYIEPFANPLSTNPENGTLPEVSNPHEVTLEPGAQTELRVIMQPRARRHIGLFPKRYAIEVAATPKQAAQPQVHKFELFQRPFIPSWLSFFLFIGLFWSALFLTTPRIIRTDPALFSKLGDIAPDVQVTLPTWQTYRFVGDMRLNINNSTGPEVSSTTDWYRLTTDHRAVVTFPEQGKYIISLTAQNRLFDWPIIGGRKLGLREEGRVYGKDVYSYTVEIAPSLTISDTTIPAGRVGPVTLTLSYLPTKEVTVTVKYTMTDKTAIYGPLGYSVVGDIDNNKRTGVLTFTAGVSTTISIPISTTSSSDSYQKPKTFVVELSEPKKAVFRGKQSSISATVTITDDQELPQLSIVSRPVFETEKSMVFTATLDRPSAEDVSFTVVPSGGNALAGTDYITTTLPESITIPAGSTATTFSVELAPDDIADGNKTLRLKLKLFDDKQATLGGTGEFTGTINDDETDPTISINDAENGESANNLTFIIEVSPVYAAGTITLSVNVQEQTATANTDFKPLATQQITIPASQPQYLLSIPMISDLLKETDETLVVTLFDVQPKSASLGRSVAIGKIIDDDTTPTISIENAVANEREGSIPFTVRLSSVLAEAVTFAYATNNESALAGVDYVLTQNTSTIPAGETSSIIRIPILNDEMYENDETFNVTLANVKTGSGNMQPILGNSQANGRIMNDDPTPAIRISDANAVESDRKICFNVSLSNPSYQEVRVNYRTTPGLAQESSDYQYSDGTIIIASGQVKQMVEIAIENDGTLDDNLSENFIVAIYSPIGAIITDAEATGLIYDLERNSTVLFPLSTCAQ